MDSVSSFQLSTHSAFALYFWCCDDSFQIWFHIKWCAKMILQQMTLFTICCVSGTRYSVCLYSSSFIFDKFTVSINVRIENIDKSWRISVELWLHCEPNVMSTWARPTLNIPICITCIVFMWKKLNTEHTKPITYIIHKLLLAFIHYLNEQWKLKTQIHSIGRQIHIKIVFVLCPVEIVKYYQMLTFHSKS